MGGGAGAGRPGRSATVWCSGGGVGRANGGKAQADLKSLQRDVSCQQVEGGLWGLWGRDRQRCPYSQDREGPQGTEIRCSLLKLPRARGQGDRKAGGAGRPPERASAPPRQGGGGPAGWSDVMTTTVTGRVIAPPPARCLSQAVSRTSCGPAVLSLASTVLPPGPGQHTPKGLPGLQAAISERRRWCRACWGTVRGCAGPRLLPGGHR